MRRTFIVGFIVLSVAFGFALSADAQSAPGTEGLWAQLRALQAQLQVLMEQARLQQISVPVPSVPSSAPLPATPSIPSGYITLDEVQGSPRVSCTPPVVRPKSSGSAVSLLQLILKQEGSYPEGFVTGYYGRLTQAAVERFQQSRGLSVSGIVDATTAKQLTELTGKFYPEECGTTSGVGHVYSFDNVNGFYVLRGDNLRSVQLWRVPTGTGISASLYEHFADMMLESNGMQFDVPAGSVPAQKWSYNIACPIPLVTNIFARASDMNGRQLADVNLPVTGVSALSDYLCGSQTSGITVLSPNGGETWEKGTMQAIKWQDDTIPICLPGAYCTPQALKNYDIKLVSYYPPCMGNTCPMYSVAMPYTIANSASVSGSSYNWLVGKILNFDGTSGTAPDSSYTVQVCHTGTDVCDSSDSYFKIVSLTTNGPTISGVSGPQLLNVGQTGTWTVRASDPNGGNLSYSVVWGDEVCPSGINCLQTALSPQQTATFTHSYAQAGTYTATFTVTNASGQSAQTSLSVNVRGTVSINRPPVLNLISVPVNIQAGQLVNFTFSATDPDNDNLVWSIGWGDGTGEASPCPIPNPQQGQGWTKSVSHTWANTGVYNVQYSVSDCRGGTASSSFTVNVGNVVVTPSITVTSPQAGETWRVGGVYSIRWISNDLTMRPVASRVSITLNSPRPACLDANPACMIAERLPYVIAENVPDTGSYAWAIPTSLPEAYRGAAQITVARTSAPAAVGRSGTFYIISTTTPTNIVTFTGAEISSVSKITQTTGGSVYLITIYSKSQTPLVSIVSDARAVDGLAKITAMAERMNKIIGDATQYVTVTNPTFYDVFYTLDGARSGYSAFTDAVTITQALGGAAPSGGSVAGAATGPSREALLANLAAIAKQLQTLLNQLR